MHILHLIGIFILSLVFSAVFWSQAVDKEKEGVGVVWAVVSLLTAIGVTLLFIGKV
jgi:hypothetical protein